MAFDPNSLETIIEPICRAHGVELVDIRYGREPGGAVLRVFIDRDRPAGVPMNEGGVSLEDCTNVSRDLSTALDVQDAISQKYRLEVSSPGIERPLVRVPHFEKFSGHEARISTKAPIGDRKSFEGLLRGVEGETILLEVSGAVVRLPFSEIAKANLVHRWTKSRK